MTDQSQVQGEPQVTAPEPIINIPALVDAIKSKKIENWPVRANYASRSGESCVRKLVYERVRWQDKIMHDVGLQYIFDEGNRIEKSIGIELLEAGIEVMEGQRRYEDTWGLQISGKIDGKLAIQAEGRRYRIPIEFKSINPYDFGSIVPERVESVLNHKKEHIRGYALQLMLYMAMEKPEPVELGILLFKCKSTGRYKQITVHYDATLIEQVKVKFAQVNEHAAAYQAVEVPEGTEPEAALALREATLPARIIDRTKCRTCAFRNACLPDVSWNAITDIRNDEQLRSLLEVAISTWSQAADNAEADEKIKELVKGYAEANCKADKETLFIVNSAYEVAVKRHGKQWRVTYNRIGAGKEVEA